MKLEIWIWTHEWDDDHSVSLYHSEAAARGAVQAYVLDQWNEGHMDDAEMPGDPNDAVQMYFDIMEDVEWSFVSRQFVDLPGSPQDKDTIDLTPEEVRAVVFALGNANYGALAEVLNLPIKQVSEIVDNAYNKLAD